MLRTLEVCCFNVESCRSAERAGAVRVELCDNPIEGGTTPSYGTIKKARESIKIALHPIIRPRSMNYLYSEEEWEIIREDIAICKSLGCDGIAIGMQLITGNIDTERMKRAVELAYPMDVTCIRVFDAVPDPFEALEQLIDAGCNRILTSGQAASAPEGTVLLKKLVEKADGRISIMPGAGIRPENLAHLIEETGAMEFHSSARIKAENPVRHKNTCITDAGSHFIADEAALKAMVGILTNRS
jgi:copper homeostasis protein